MYERYGWNDALGGYELRDSDTRLVTDVAADDEPLSFDDEVIHSRLDLGSPADPAEQAYVESLFPAARKIVESIIGKPIGVQEFEYMLTAFPCGAIIELPRPDVSSVVSIKYKKDDGTTVTYYDSSASPAIDPDTLEIEMGCTPAAIFLKAGESWPIENLSVGFPVKIRFMAGLATIPGDVMQAMRMVFGYLYENREIASEATVNSLPRIEEWLQNNHGYRRII